jgi:hypothetical protein
MVKRFPNFPWYYVTRGLGAFLVMYGLLIDDSAERGTIILSGLGLLGVDKVARSDASAEGASPKKVEKPAETTAPGGKE